MNTDRRPLTRHAVDWALAALTVFVVLFLNAYLEHQHSDTATARLSAQVSNDRAAEHAALKGPR